MIYDKHSKRSNKKALNQKLKSDLVETGASGPGVVLGTIFKDMRFANKIDETDAWGHHVELFLQDPRNNVPKDRHSQSSARGNLHKELLKLNMSWKVFCKGLRFLRIFKIKITIETFHINGDRKIHTKEVDFTNLQMEPPGSDLDDDNDE